MEVVIKRKKHGLADVHFVIPLSKDELNGDVTVHEAALFIADKAYKLCDTVSKIKSEVQELVEATRDTRTMIHERMIGGRE